MKNDVSTPPRRVFRLLSWFCPGHLLEEIEGDLHQRYARDVKRWGAQKAKRRLVWNTLRFFRPGILLRNKPATSLTSFYMIGSYLKIASRVTMRSKTYSAINVLGLTLGITGAMLLFLWIEKEFTYDQFHADKERIYKVWNREARNGDVSCWSMTPRILAPTLEQEYASVESAVSYATYGSSQLFTVGNKRLVSTSGVYTDAQFLTMFSFPLLKGTPATALKDPISIVLTESFAKQLFGDRDPFGETLTIGESGYSFSFTVSGILKDLPSNTDFHFDYLIPWQFLESIGEKDTYWGNNSVSTYVKLKEGEDVSRFNELVKDVVKKHANESVVEVFLYPLTKMRLYSRFENGVQSGGRIGIIRMLGILGICLIAIACINFINLSTARAQKRSKEVGVRKVTGAYRHSLILQFLCESVLLALGAGIISIAVVYLSLPWFSALVEQPLSLNVQSVLFWLIIIASVMGIGVLAGAYPAFYLSSFHPVRILTGAPVTSSNRNRLRQVLVVFQFGFAVTLVISVIVISRQITFTQERETGYAKNNLLYLPLTDDLVKNYHAYKNDLLSKGIATSVTKTSAPITEQWSNTTEMSWRGKDPQNKPSIERFYVDESIVPTAGLTIVEGRDLDLVRYPSDSTAVLLNETAAKLMGFTQPVGEMVMDNGIEWHVVGVVKDFILLSPYQKITPLVLQGSKQNMFNVIHVRLNPEYPVQENIAAMETLFFKYESTYPFEYHFVDEEYNRKFASLEKTLTITTLFGSMAIFISCLGLLGLSTFMIESRVKEIGIRKVLGGSTATIMKLLSVDALKPILLAIVLFTPMSWMSMNWWLQSFDYRITLSVGIFLLAGASILTIAWITIAVQTLSAASANPVKSLRTE